MSDEQIATGINIEEVDRAVVLRIKVLPGQNLEPGAKDTGVFLGLADEKGMIWYSPSRYGFELLEDDLAADLDRALAMWDKHVAEGTLKAAAINTDTGKSVSEDERSLEVGDHGVMQ